MLAVICVSCKKDEPIQPHTTTIQLAVEDVSCTEAYLRVSLADVNEPRTVAIQQDGQRVVAIDLVSLDSTVILEGLLPRHTYSFVAQRMRDSVVVEASSPAQATTMDTTSRSFSFQIDTLGTSSSVLSDVAIVRADPDSPLVYAAGEIYLQGDPDAYNVAKWDGTSWELMRIPFIGPCSAVDYPPLKAIWAISANQILVTNGGAIATYNGTTTTLDCRMNSLLIGAINKLYATSAQDIYAVGDNGAIVHYSSGTWRRVESGTTIPLTDVYGSPDGSVVWVTGYTLGVPAGTVLIRIMNGQAESIRVKDMFSPWLDSLSGALDAVWTVRNNWTYVLSTFGMYRCPVGSTGEAKLIPLPGTYFGYGLAMRGVASNDVAFCGGDLIWHFNGVSLSRAGEFHNSLFDLRSIAYTNNYVVAVGEQYHPIYSKGLAIIGRRN